MIQTLCFERLLKPQQSVLQATAADLWSLQVQPLLQAQQPGQPGSVEYLATGVKGDSSKVKCKSPLQHGVNDVTCKNSIESISWIHPVY